MGCPATTTFRKECKGSYAFVDIFATEMGVGARDVMISFLGRVPLFFSLMVYRTRNLGVLSQLLHSACR